MLGVSDFQTPLETWQNIEEELHPGFNFARGYTLPVRPADADLPAFTRWGWAFEDSVHVLAEERGNCKISSREKFFAIDLHGDPCEDGQITAHVDGIEEVDGPTHEFKTTSTFMYAMKWGTEDTDRVTPDIAVQVQHHFLARKNDIEKVSVLVFPFAPDDLEKKGGWRTYKRPDGSWLLQRIDLSADFPLVLEEVEPLTWARSLAQMGFFKRYTIHVNPEAQAAMLAAYRHFWEHNVLGEVPPDPKNYEDVRRLFPAPKGTIVCDDTLSGWLREYKDIRDELGGKGMLSRRADELKVLALDRARKLDATIDDESREKTIFRDQAGQKLGQYDGKTFRV